MPLTDKMVSGEHLHIAHMAQAKLLSQKERPAAVQGLEQFSTKTPQFSVVVIAVILVAAAYFSTFSIQIIRTLLASNVDLRRCDVFLSTVFAFRPLPYRSDTFKLSVGSPVIL
jgi:hypothetical protein